MCGIGRADIQYSVSSLSRFSADPRSGQLDKVIRMCSYLKDFPDREIVIDHRDIPMLKNISDPEDLTDQYPDAGEELEKEFPEALGPPLQTSVFFDSDHGHDQKTRRSCTGLVVMVGRTPVSWSTKRQTAIQTSSYGAEFMAGRSACQEAISIR